jgi:hypothetical protein
MAAPESVNDKITATDLNTSLSPVRAARGRRRHHLFVRAGTV